MTLTYDRRDEPYTWTRRHQALLQHTFRMQLRQREPKLLVHILFVDRVILRA